MDPDGNGQIPNAFGSPGFQRVSRLPITHLAAVSTGPMRTVLSRPLPALGGHVSSTAVCAARQASRRGCLWKSSMPRSLSLTSDSVAKLRAGRPWSRWHQPHRAVVLHNGPSRYAVAIKAKLGMEELLPTSQRQSVARALQYFVDRVQHSRPQANSNVRQRLSTAGPITHL